MTDIEFYDTIKLKIGDGEARAVIGYIDGKLKENNEQNYTILATKQDLTATRQEFKEEMIATKQELKTDIAGLKLYVSEKIADTRSDIMRWMFAFFITIVLAFIGLYFKK